MRRVIAASVVLLLLTPCAGRLTAQPGSGTVRIDLPPAVLVQIVDVSAAEVSSSTARVSFNQAFLSSGQALRISVRADSGLVLPHGGIIPASAVRWTTSQVNNGLGINGALHTGIFAPVYESHAGSRAGRVDLTFHLTLPPGITRAGTAQMTLRWKLEAITP